MSDKQQYLVPEFRKAGWAVKAFAQTWPFLGSGGLEHISRSVHRFLWEELQDAGQEWQSAVARRLKVQKGNSSKRPQSVLTHKSLSLFYCNAFRPMFTSRGGNSEWAFARG